MKILANYRLLQPLKLSKNALSILSYLVWAKIEGKHFAVEHLKDNLTIDDKAFNIAYNELILRDLIEFCEWNSLYFCARKTDCMQLLFRISDNQQTTRTTPQTAKESDYVPFP